MKKKTVFRGIATALITPFKDGRIDFDAYGRFIDWQIENGINALVACGTTGESSTLSDAEHRAALAFAVKRAAGRVPVIARIRRRSTVSDTVRARYEDTYRCPVCCGG